MSSQRDPQHPSKLAKDAVIEAVCEVRFDAQAGTSGFLPGMLFSQLRGLFSGIERMPTSDIPPILLQMDPNMQYIATQKLKGDGFSVIVGDRVVGIACSPYLGWLAFKELILKVWAVLADCEFVGTPNRTSLKYVNILDGHGSDLRSMTNIRLQIGSLEIRNQPLQVRTEIVANDYNHIITIANPAAAQGATPEERKEGCVVDVDILRNSPDRDLLRNGAEQLDELHKRAKDLFFDVLSENALAARGPTYG